VTLVIVLRSTPATPATVSVGPELVICTLLTVPVIGSPVVLSVYVTVSPIMPIAWLTDWVCAEAEVFWDVSVSCSTAVICASSVRY